MKSLYARAAGFVLLFLMQCASAQLPTVPAIQGVPPNVSPDPNLPMAMLNVSKDYSMFSRAYTDYDDLDFDGAIDYTFMPYFKYYGYFDPTKCYSYSSSDGNFVPDSKASTESAAGDPSGTTRYYCRGASVALSNGSLWSGNFLNWATMSRMDVLRKILFGGLRSTDDATKTVLELSFVPRNSQAYAKYYNGSDLNRLTPFNFSDGVTLCRRHENPNGDNTLSQSSTLRPVIRIAQGNYILWNMTEVRTCNFSNEVGYAWKAATVDFVTANYVGAGGASTHRASVPSSGTDYIGRVEACKSTDLIGDERCKQYPNGDLKPIGLLHEFGESDNYGSKAARSEFALMLGSFDSNLDGGVLRKNMSEINDEIDSNTGAFTTFSNSNINKRGIIYTLSALRPYGYAPNGGSYTQSCLSSDISNGACPSWGNPISEILLEGLRYYAGKAALYNSGNKDAEFGLPKPTWSDPLKATRTYSNSSKTREALYGKNICRPLNMVTISSGIGTFDDDKMDAFTNGLSAPKTAAYYTNQIGTSESISGSTRLVGTNGSSSTGDGLCTGKLIAGLGSVAGLCPDGPNMRGTYLGAGAALYAHTNKIRNDLTVPVNANSEVLKVRQYAVTMSGGSATLRIAVPGTSPQRYVFVTPASLDYNNNQINGLAGNLVDFKVLKRAADGSSGTFLVLWQHNSLGEDQDQDMLGSIRYETDTSTNPATLKIYTQTLESDTGSSAKYAFGYTVVGTNRDGTHFHSGINNYISNESPAATYAASSVQTGDRKAANKCYLNDDGTTFNGWNYGTAPRLCVRIGNDFVKGETMLSYRMAGSTDAVIQDPLWYIAKYGGFKDDAENPSGFPDTAGKWDVKRADGVACGATGQPSCSDGVPDNYYLARRPDLLESSLREVFADLSGTINSAPAVSRSDLISGAYKYVASYSATDLHGELLAYALDDDGNFATTPSASGHVNLTNMAASARQVVTNVGTTGAAFTSAGLSGTGASAVAYRTSLGSNATVQQARIDYLRGIRTGEKQNGGSYRNRALNSIMGGVVNSNPFYQDIPRANYFGSGYPGYGTFRTAQQNRSKLIWLGAGDGMLHAFNASSLTPVLSYVPQPLVPRLQEVMDPSVTDVRAYMDGSPFVADVMTSTASTSWRSYLFASLGRGGKGIFALDVTAPANSTSNALTEANAASIFRWQFTSSDDADLGYVISEGGLHPTTNQAAQIAKMPNGKFALLVGNGVSSTSGKAVLYILFVEGPGSSGTWVNNTNYKKIVVDTGSGNGLMQPSWIDTDGDGFADTIYAGDLKGNLWKFNVSDANPANWTEAYGKPLYIAADAAGALLPITTAPAIRFASNGGQVVVFGTGQSIVSGDFPDSNTSSSHSQRIFGILDKASYGSDPSTIPRGVTDLQARSWTVDSTSGGIVQGSTTALSSAQKGWYVNIPLSSGMVLSNPRVSGKLVDIPIVYKAISAEAACNDNALGADVQINAETGLASVSIYGLTSSTGIVLGLTGLDQRFSIARDSTKRCAGGLACDRIVGVKTDKVRSQNPTQSRIFWREIPGLKTAN